MQFRHYVLFFSGLFTLSFVVPTQAAQKPRDKDYAKLNAVADAEAEKLNNTIYGKIANELLRSYNIGTENKVLSANDSDAVTQEIDKVVEKKKKDGSLNKIEIAEVDDITKRVMVFQIFAQNEARLKKQPGHILNPFVWRDLNLFYNQNNPDAQVFRQINRTRTTFGEACLARRMVEVETNPQELLRRQSITKTLLNPKYAQVRKQINASLKAIGQAENMFLSYWQKESAMMTQLMTFFRPDEMIINRTTIVDLREAYNNFSVVLGGVAMAGTAAAAVAGGVALIANDQPAFGAMAMTYGALYAYLVYELIKGFKIMLDARKSLHAQANSFALFTRQAEKIYEMVADIPGLSKNLSLFNRLKEIARTQESLTDEMRVIVELLRDSKFKKTPSRMSLNAKVYKLEYWMRKIKYDFANLMEAIGEIDMYCSIATLFEEYQNKENSVGDPLHFCFVDFDTESTTPNMHLTNFWNPRLPDKSVIVPSSLRLGGKHIPYRNVLLTGPNTGGKSTVLNGVILSMMLAQSLGIAPAESMRMTPFSQVLTHLNITDDITKGESKFMAEALRAISVIDSVQKLPSNEFCFIIMDEIFSGTEPLPGQECAYAIAELLAKYPNVITIIATHYKGLTNLPTTTKGAYHNFMVTVNKLADGKLEFPYKLEEGKANVNVALDILRNELRKRGMKAEFLDSAQARLDAQAAH